MTTATNSATPSPHRTVNDVLVLTPYDRQGINVFRALAILVSNIWNWRELLWQLFKRDFFGAYKKSFLGYAWLFISPLVGIVSWLIMNYTGILRPGNVGVSYAAYVLVGTTIWTFFVGTYGAASATLTSGSSLLTQVKYPHEILLAKQLAQVAANFSISFILVVLVLIVSDVPFHLSAFLFPLVVLPLLFFAMALGLVAAMVAVVAPDITHAASIGLGLMIYLSPIIYSPDAHGNDLLGRINSFNPLTHLVCSPRDLLLYGRLYDSSGYAWSALLSLVAFILAWRIFFVAESRLIEKMV